MSNNIFAFRNCRRLESRGDFIKYIRFLGNAAATTVQPIFIGRLWIGVMPNDPKMAGAATPDKNANLTSLGIELAPAPDGAGVQITGVQPDSPAADRGLKPGDVIMEVAGREVHTPGDVKDALKDGTKKRVLMLVRSGGGQRFIALPLDRG